MWAGDASFAVPSSKEIALTRPLSVPLIAAYMPAAISAGDFAAAHSRTSSSAPRK